MLVVERLGNLVVAGDCDCLQLACKGAGAVFGHRAALDAVPHAGQPWAWSPQKHAPLCCLAPLGLSNMLRAGDCLKVGTALACSMPARVLDQFSATELLRPQSLMQAIPMGNCLTRQHAPLC